MTNTIESSMTDLRGLLVSQHAQFSSINTFVSEASHSKSLDCIFHLITKCILSAPRINRSSLYVLDGEQLVAISANSMLDSVSNPSTILPIENFKTFRLGEGIAGVVALKNKQIYVTDCLKDPEFISLSCQREVIPRSLLCTPIVGEDGLIGILNTSSVEESNFNPIEQQFVQTFCDIAGLVLQNVKLLNELESEISIRTASEKEALEKARHTTQSKYDVILGMGHNFKTPLNAIIGFSHLINNKTSTDDETRGNAKMVLDSGKYLLSLINELLDLAKLESVNVEITLEQVDINELIENCINMLTSEADQKRVSISYPVLNDTAVMVITDKLKLKQTLLNLLSNAVKYNNKNEGKVVIELEVNDSQLQLSVIDNGPGIPESEHEEVFKPFFRLDNNTDGTGFGLAVSRILIEMVGGSMGCRSAPNGGCIFWIQIPLKYTHCPL